MLLNHWQLCCVSKNLLLILRDTSFLVLLATAHDIARNLHGITGKLASELHGVAKSAGNSANRVAGKDLANSITRDVEDSITSLEGLGNDVLTSSADTIARAAADKAAQRSQKTAQVHLALGGLSGGSGSNKAGRGDDGGDD